MISKQIGFLLIAAFAFAACESAPDIQAEATPGANISAYQTYEWVRTNPPPGFSPVAYERLRQNIENQLLAKGYKAAKPGELAVVATVGAQDRTNITSWGPFAHDLDVRQYTEGKLAVDVFDIRTRRALWHGQATQDIDPNKIDPVKLDAAVTSIMAQFPPHRQ